jgi:transcriptional regulator with XRE-family HTH domain
MTYNTIGDKIKSLRIQNNLTQRDLADKLSVSVSTISHWENGRRLPSITDLQRLGVHFDVNLSVFELEQTMNIPVSESGTASIRTQSINIRPLESSLHPLFYLLFILSVITQASALFFEKPLNLVMLILGIALSAIPVTALLLSNAFVQSKRSLTLPITNHLMFEHTLQQDSIDLFHKLLRYCSHAGMLITLISYSLLTHLLRIHDYTVLSLFVAIFALLVLVLHYLRSRTFCKNPVFERKIDYYHAPFIRKHPLINLSCLVEYASLVLFGFAVNVFLDVLDVPILAVLSIVLLALNVLVSFSILIIWQAYIRRFLLIAIDEKGNKFPLF